MRYLLIIGWMFSLSSCQTLVSFVEIYPSTCGEMSGSDPFSLKPRITHKEFQDGMLYLGMEFSDNCALMVEPWIKYNEDTLEVFAYQKLPNEVFLCYCCFGINGAIAGLDKDRIDSLVIVLHRLDFDDLQLVETNSNVFEYNLLDFNIIKGDTIFYEITEPEFLDLNNPIYAKYGVSAYFENDYGLYYQEYVQDQYEIRVKDNKYYHKNFQDSTTIRGLVSYSPIITLPDGRKGCEVFFHFKSKWKGREQII